MFAAYLFALIIFCSTEISYASDGQRRIFCTYYVEQGIEVEVSKNKQKGRPRCMFSRGNKDICDVESVTCPAFENWHSPDDLGKTDKLISGGAALPYTYNEIKEHPDINAYVLAREYEPQKVAALLYLNGKYAELKCKDEPRALERIIYYTGLLETVVSYAHPCPGLIVPKRALMCVAQWAHFGEDAS